MNLRRLWTNPLFREKVINSRKGKPFKKSTVDKRKGKTYIEIYGGQRAAEIKAKIRAANKGRVPLNRLDPILKKITDAKIRESVKRRFAEDPTYKRRCLSSHRPTSLESSFQNFAHTIGLPVTYVGDGRFWIDNYNPDFIDAFGRKVCYELYCRMWHKAGDDLKRISLFKSLGWKCIVIWDKEMNNKIKLLNKLKEELACESIFNINHHILLSPN
jgi:hypothetical protein